LAKHLVPGLPNYKLDTLLAHFTIPQHAATEANILHHQAEHCPTLARTNLIDTIPLAKHLVPGLPNYKLDTLLAHFTIPQPPNRHRAPDDVDVTTKIFLHLIAAADLDPRLNSLTALLKTAGRTAKANQPVQAGLFDT
ncbi:exonuclease domain-containing protein, partial [Kitasatospora sp. NPDC091257]|uniref:exonuclease domain-containing protein n=1 Tax=Kitasatospora sp. NPDC091257 TaxID=3364084 RepID=UPI00382FCFE9